jgi:hypothetical protein
MLVDAELAATRDGASAEARRIREQMVDEGLEPASPAERRYWRHLEAAKKRVQIIGPPVPAYGKQFKDQEALQKAVREHLGFGHGSNFAEPTEISKEAAQIINRLRVAIDDAIRFVRSPEEDERRLGPGPADQAADLLRKWVDALRGSDIDWLPPVPIGGDLERLIDWWTTHPHEEMRPKTDREMAEIALRAGYFPMVDMRKHPTVADVIAQVRRAVRQIQNGH